MLKKIKKVIMFALTMTMLMGMGIIAFAAEEDSGTLELSMTNAEGMIVEVSDNTKNFKVDIVEKGQGIGTFWWPGNGAAPQVTRIQLDSYGWLKNGNFGVVLKVYGYGSDTTTFNGKRISWIEQEPFIISGTGADGFYYLYDCGPVTSPGSYSFQSVFRSTNSPYKQVTFSDVFTFSAN